MKALFTMGAKMKAFFTAEAKVDVSKRGRFQTWTFPSVDVSKRGRFHCYGSRK